jgi:hypothetical protein
LQGIFRGSSLHLILELNECNVVATGDQTNFPETGESKQNSENDKSQQLELTY